MSAAARAGKGKRNFEILHVFLHQALSELAHERWLWPVQAPKPFANKEAVSTYVKSVLESIPFQDKSDVRVMLDDDFLAGSRDGTTVVRCVTLKKEVSEKAGSLPVGVVVVPVENGQYYQRAE